MALNDDELIQALRQRIKEQIASLGASGSPASINNYVGGMPSQPYGITGGMLAQNDSEPDDSDYFVDISRRDVEPLLDEKTGKVIQPGGWDKKVHRFKTKKGEEPPKKKRG